MKKFSNFHALMLVVCVLLGGCHRAPGTAAELQQELPRQFRGEFLMQGSAQAQQLVVEPHEFSVRGEHLLEFNKVRYQVVAGSEVMAEGDAEIRGTISTPELEIRIEQAGREAGGEAMKVETFTGHLEADLHTAEATWVSGLGQKVTLKMKATGL